LTTEVSVLIFDLDGTLVDSMGALADIFCEILAQHGVATDLSREVYFALAGMGPERQFEQALRRAGLLDVDAELLTEAFWGLSKAISPAAFPEVPAALAALDAAGYAMFISSGGRTDFARKRAESAGIAGYFRLILGTDKGVPRMAKGPGHFELISADLAPAQDALRELAAFVGDGPYDMQVAAAAGILAIGP
jgi:phosphoglycolate phosphatase